MDAEPVAFSPDSVAGRLLAVLRDLLAALTDDPAGCLALMLTLAAQVRDLRTRLELRNIRSASERVLAWLQLHARGNPPHVVTDRSWTLIADELGLTREALYRTLAKLEREQRITRRPDAVYFASSLVAPLAHLTTDGATRNGDAKNSAA